MRFFMQSGVCRRIMAPSRSGDEAALVHWVQDANETPSGRRHIGACNKKAGVRGSVSLTLPRATSEAPVPLHRTHDYLSATPASKRVGGCGGPCLTVLRER
jgi:hypothetical protein